MKKVFLIVCLQFGLSQFFPAFCQSNISSIISQVVRDTKEGKAISCSLEPLFISKNISPSIELLKSHTLDSSSMVRYQAYDLIASLGKKSGDPIIRKQSILISLKGTQDLDPAVSELSWNNILGFSRADFNGTPTDFLNKYSANLTQQPDLWAKAMAYLNLKAKQNEIKVLLDSKLNPKQKWQVHLALVRLGDSNSTDYILSRITKSEINDDWIISLASDLVFTHSKPVFNILFQIIQDKSKQCKSVHPDSNEPIPCAYRVLEHIAPSISNFPVKKDASGDLVGDYQKALKTARDWISSNSNSYQFND